MLMSGGSSEWGRAGRGGCVLCVCVGGGDFPGVMLPGGGGGFPGVMLPGVEISVNFISWF